MATNQYIVSARKYRPATFQSVVGQKALTSTLKNAIQGGKLAQAYLFCGPRGVGKTSCARIFAKTINCMNPTSEGEACGECESCKAIEKGNSFNLIELDAASNNSVDDIRSITEQVNIPAQDGRYRVFIIDEVHMLSNNAFNAFLKTLEEPPKNVVFILATTERHKVIPTILSRCQVYDFRRITINDIIDHLQYVSQREGVVAEREALGVIALKADGAMRDALSIFDQVVASTHGYVTYQGTLEALNVLDQDYYFRLMDIFRKGDAPEALLTLKEITDKGFDPQFFVNGLAEHIRNLMVSADSRTVKLLETSEDLAKRYIEQAALFPVEWYYSAMKILNDTDYNYRLSNNKRLLVELALIRLSRLLTPTQPASPSSPPFAAPEDNNRPQVAPAKKEEAQREEPKDAGNKESPSSVTPAPGKKEMATEEPRAKFTATQPEGRRSANTRLKSFRLSSEIAQASSTKGNEPLKKPFDKEEFQKVWDEFAEAHPEQRILVAAMRGSKPEPVDDTAYKVVVDHPAQRQAFESVLNEMLQFFKARLENDYISLKVEVDDKAAEGRGMSSKEFLKLVIDENEPLARFLKEMDAELD